VEKDLVCLEILTFLLAAYFLVLTVWQQTIGSEEFELIEGDYFCIYRLKRAVLPKRRRNKWRKKGSGI